MSRFVLAFVVLLVAVATAAPIEDVQSNDDIDPQKLCKNCPMLVKMFLNNKNIEEKVFDKLCEKVLGTDDKNPMVKVCEAGLMGELEHVKDEISKAGLTPAQICKKLHVCPAH